ncbi:PFL_4669 family integrating conjugative element protein [Serratia microhaemolytica]|uniref:PFL_4669 family integrating conjugative element protein n=1 Tax=Serratia microhaemolytica TaxID=2675110 RepID=UPI000FDD5A12|nr:TIGR03761 family integrating conjugative element protein [Serratia microhaemolytica]
MAEIKSKSQKIAEGEPPRSGALTSTLSIALHTHYAIRLWDGRKSDDEKHKRTDILSMPEVIQRAGRVFSDSAADNPYADALLMKLETTLNASSAKIALQVRELESILADLPKGVTLSEVTSTHPLNIGVYSRSPLGYRCVWLLVGYDQLVMKTFQAWHYGLIARSMRDHYLSEGGYAVRQVYGVIRTYRVMPVTRDDIRHSTERGQKALSQLGELDPDIFSGKKRSSFVSSQLVEKDER